MADDGPRKSGRIWKDPILAFVQFPTPEASRHFVIISGQNWKLTLGTGPSALHLIESLGWGKNLSQGKTGYFVSATGRGTVVHAGCPASVVVA
jgi:hypothetical protein